MTEPKAFRDGVQFAFDSTSIKLAEECLRKYQYKMIEGWQPARKSVHLLFGAWYASALENFHYHIAAGMPREDALYEVVSTALFETWEYEFDDEGLVIAGSGTPWTSDHNTKTRENLIRTIVWYLDHFADDAAATVILANGDAAVEHTFAIPVDNDIIFAGHLDRLVEYAGHTYVQDQKTTGSTITPRYFEGYNPDTQMSMYSFAGKIAFNSPVAGVMIDAAQIAVGFTRFERGFTFRSAAQLDEWYDHTMLHIERVRHATRENEFPMTRTSCSNYGGCEFRGICSRSPEVRKNFLAGDFVQGERWDPLRAR